MNCKHCQSACIKAGLQQNGDQRYYCKECKKYQKHIYKYQAYKERTDQKIIILLKEGCGIRSIGRILHISFTTVIARIKTTAKRINSPAFILKGRTYELDEMRTYIRRKNNLYWIVYAVDKTTKQVIDFRVGKRNKRTLKTVTDTLLLSQAKTIFTDKYRLYQYLIPSCIHSNQRYKTNHIERMNLKIRTDLKRLARRTICFSKSILMLESILKIYFWHEQKSLNYGEGNS